MKKTKPIYWIFVILVGSILGSIIGSALDEYLPILNFGKSVSLDPATLNLEIFTLTFGFSLKLTVAGIIGIVLALFIFKKLS